jgi:acyl-CoA dehydrogenase
VGPILSDIANGWVTLAWIIMVAGLGYSGAPFWLWYLSGLVFIALFHGVSTAFWVWAILGALFVVRPIRRLLISAPLMRLMKPFMPVISDTEKTALEAGVVWVEKDLFSGKPDFKKLLHEEKYPGLTPDEKKFMDHQVEHLCSLIDHWKIWKTREMEQAIWEYMKKEKFLGMIIPKEYGGLGFSALAHSEVIHKLSSRSLTATITVMVPNSLGPAELLVHYGTDEQKKRYLPRLATGEEIPAFALTEPGAGSDAGSIQATGELFRGEDGELYIRLNWNKRWITLAAISTVLGVAFRLRDPKNLLGRGEDVGITCALISSNTPGVVLGRRHDPLGVPFYNCPTQGKDVVVKAQEAIIGGLEWAGKGWQMLMESLAAGRGISLPAQATGGSKLACMVTSAHAVNRKQFGVNIGQFEGVKEPLSRIAAHTYMLEAMRRYTCGALDQGIKPPVITAMMKYHATEAGRRVINDAMDVMGGAGISLGPRNVLAEIYTATPIGITVEGANIMTRTLIIFGQGALRAHPYAYLEVKAIAEKDVALFDRAFWGHIGHVVRNTFRSILLSLTRGYLASAPVSGPLKPYVRRLSWASASFAILADLAMGTLGGSLKFREYLTGRFADILSHLFMATATLRRFIAEGEPEKDLAVVKMSLKWNLFEIQKAFDGIFDNMYGVEQKSLFGKILFGSLHFLFKEVLGAWSRINSLGSQATDHLKSVVVDKMLYDEEFRNHLVSGIYTPQDAKDPVGRLNHARALSLKAMDIDKKIYSARRKGVLPRVKGEALYQAALEKGVVTQAELDVLKQAELARWDAIQVDDYDEHSFKHGVWIS